MILPNPHTNLMSEVLLSPILQKINLRLGIVNKYGPGHSYNWQR